MSKTSLIKKIQIYHFYQGDKTYIIKVTDDRDVYESVFTLMDFLDDNYIGETERLSIISDFKKELKQQEYE